MVYLDYLLIIDFKYNFIVVINVMFIILILEFFDTSFVTYKVVKFCNYFISALTICLMHQFLIKIC